MWHPSTLAGTYDYTCSKLQSAPTTKSVTLKGKSKPKLHASLALKKIDGDALRRQFRSQHQKLLKVVFNKVGTVDDDASGLEEFRSPLGYVPQQESAPVGYVP